VGFIGNSGRGVGADPLCCPERAVNRWQSVFDVVAARLGQRIEARKPGRPRIIEK